MSELEQNPYEAPESTSATQSRLGPLPFVYALAGLLLLTRNLRGLRRVWNASLWSDPRAGEIAWIQENRLQFVVLAAAMVTVIVSAILGFWLGRTRGGKLAAAFVFIVGAGAILAVDNLWKL